MTPVVAQSVDQVGTPRLLVVEDEPAIADAIVSRLVSEGFEARSVSDGREAVDVCQSSEFSLDVLDLGLPGLDGIEVCRRIRSHRPTPVIMLAARDAEADMLVGLGIGADDYLTKPFSPRELVARIRAVLRRVEQSHELVDSGQLAVLEVGRIFLDPASRRAKLADQIIHLTPTEFDLLHYLAADLGRVFTREHLLCAVWGYRDGSGARTVDSHIRSIRRKLGDDIVRTVHGVGYAIGDSTPGSGATT